MQATSSFPASCAVRFEASSSGGAATTRSGLLQGVRMRAELIPTDGGPPIPIIRDVTLIGRREYCDIQFDDPSLSKRHCVVVKTDGLLMVRDLATTNGTRVKGQRIRWAALLPNDKITIGRLNFRVHLGPADATARPAQAQAQAKPKAKPQPVPQAQPAASLASDRPHLDLDDPNWFDRVATGRGEAGAEIDEIIDLD